MVLFFLFNVLGLRQTHFLLLPLSLSLSLSHSLSLPPPLNKHQFVVGLGEKVAPTDIEEGMRVGVDRTKYQIQVPLPPKIDPSVTMMAVEEKPDITYADIGGCKEQIEKMREVVELPMLHPVSSLGRRRRKREREGVLFFFLAVDDDT